MIGTIMTDSVQILDCTLRDGSYLIDYHFTARDTYLICRGLAESGFKMIEVGHGTGLGSSLAGMGVALASDAEYLEAAREALIGSSARFGMFFIPGIGTMEQLEAAAAAGIDFVRIGVNVTETEKAEKFIRRAKELGLWVAINLMKSYAVPLDSFVEKALGLDKFGVDCITVVDSAGGMFPSEVGEYVSRLTDLTDTAVGFHGHNNLQLAVANSLEAIRCGASIVDASLQGMGRSAGNAQTEVLALSLDKMGYDVGLDSYKVLDLGERLVRPMMSREQGVDDWSIVSGIAQFHSSFDQLVQSVSKEYGVDPRRLIMGISAIERVNVTRELAQQVALTLEGEPKGEVSTSSTSLFVEDVPNGQGSVKFQRVLNELKSWAKKSDRESVMSFTLSAKNELQVPHLRLGASTVVGNCEAVDMKQLQALITQCSDEVHWIALDVSCPQICAQYDSLILDEKKTVRYSERRAVRLAVSAMLTDQSYGPIFIMANDESESLVRAYIETLGGGPVYSFSDIPSGKEAFDLGEFLSQIRCVVSFGDEFSKRADSAMAHLLPDSTVILTTCANGYTDEFWETAAERGFELIRVDSQVGLSMELELAIQTRKSIRDRGVGTVDGLKVVSGGMVGLKGTIVVDSVREPIRIIGVADGKGGLLSDDNEYSEQVRQVQVALVNSLFNRKMDENCD